MCPDHELKDFKIFDELSVQMNIVVSGVNRLPYLFTLIENLYGLRKLGGHLFTKNGRADECENYGQLIANYCGNYFTSTKKVNSVVSVSYFIILRCFGPNNCFTVIHVSMDALCNG